MSLLVRWFWHSSTWWNIWLTVRLWPLTFDLLENCCLKMFRITSMAIGMHREQIGECADDTHFWRSRPKQREQIGECVDDTHFWRLHPKQRQQIGCQTLVHFLQLDLMWPNHHLVSHHKQHFYYKTTATFNIIVASVDHFNHVIPGHVFDRIMLSPIEYLVVSWPIQSLTHSYICSYFRWNSALTRRISDCRSATPTTTLSQYDSAVSAGILFSRAKYCISRPLWSCPCFDTRICVRRNSALIDWIFSCRSASPITPIFVYIYLCPLKSCSCQSSIQLWVSRSNNSHIYIHVDVSGGILHSRAEYRIAGRPLRPLPCLNMIVLFPLESCSHELSIASVGHSDHVHVLIYGYVFAGILLSSIEYSVAGQPARSLPYLYTYTYVRWNSALVNWVLRCESASPTTLTFTYIFHVSGRLDIQF
jgi:hypothetical protein